MIKTILIDLDDTLWATYSNHKEAFHELYLTHHWEESYPSFEQLHQQYAEYNEYLWGEYRSAHIAKRDLIIERFRKPLEKLNMSNSEILALNDEFIRRTTIKTELIPGALELLKWMKPLFKVVIVSNGFIEAQTKKINGSGIAPWVDYTILSEEAGRNKPSADIFRYALDKCHSRGSESIMIGDSWDADILGAESTGLPSIWFNPSGMEQPHTLRTPLYQVHLLGEIPSILRGLIIHV